MSMPLAGSDYRSTTTKYMSGASPPRHAAQRAAGPQALRWTFLSAHLVVRATRARLVSQTDPPAALRSAAGTCRNDGIWPVLVGEQGARQTLLGSPIILPDYPAVAPGSPGDLFDGGEVDALLIHSTRALSDAEREEVRATDPRARARETLDRRRALPPEQMRDLHGRWASTARWSAMIDGHAEPQQAGSTA